MGAASRSGALRSDHADLLLNGTVLSLSPRQSVLQGACRCVLRLDWQVSAESGPDWLGTALGTFLYSPYNWYIN